MRSGSTEYNHIHTYVYMITGALKHDSDAINTLLYKFTQAFLILYTYVAMYGIIKFSLFNFDVIYI